MVSSPTRTWLVRLGLLVATVTAVGLLTALAVGLLAGFALRDQLFGFGGFAGAVGGVLAGYPLGVIGGLMVVRRIVRVRGSLWLGALGVLAGVGITALVAGPLNVITHPDAVFALYFVSISVLCGFGYLMRDGDGGTADNHER
jgi:hypothetical protein